MDDIHESFKDDLFREIFVFTSVMCNAHLFQHFELEPSVEYSDIIVVLMLCNSFDNRDDIFLELVENVVSIYSSFLCDILLTCCTQEGLSRHSSPRFL